jgi:hypothetical protein
MIGASRRAVASARRRRDIVIVAVCGAQGAGADGLRRRLTIIGMTTPDIFEMQTTAVRNPRAICAIEPRR